MKARYPCEVESHFQKAYYIRNNISRDPVGNMYGHIAVQDFHLNGSVDKLSSLAVCKPVVDQKRIGAELKRLEKLLEEREQAATIQERKTSVDVCGDQE